MEWGALSVQNVAVSSARGDDVDWLVMALLENRDSAKMGAVADCLGNCGFSDLDLEKEAMALCKFTVGG